MTVRVNKSAFNIREKLSELERPIGVKGNELMRAETAQDARDLVSAGRKNLIINGAMQVAQRGDTATSVNSTGYNGPDRWRLVTDAGTYTISRSTTAPEGFSDSWKLDCTTTGTLGASDIILFHQRIEGQNVQHLKYGTANAEQLTASFWIRSTKTGTVTVEFYQPNDLRQVSKTVTIDTANTWEYKTVTIPGDTTGVIDDTDGRGLELIIWLGAGSNFTSGTLNTTGWAAVTNANRVSSSNIDVSDNTSNDIYITGIQLEVGKNATEFEHRSYAEELALCQRYYYKDLIRYGRIGQLRTSGLMVVPFDLPVSMRPSNSVSLSTYNYWAYYDGSSPTVSGLNSGSAVGSTAFVMLNITANATLGATVFWYSGPGDLIIDSEL